MGSFVHANTPRGVAAAILAAVLLVVCAAPAAGQLTGTQPPRPDIMPPLEGETPSARVDDRLGAQVPLDLEFFDEEGQRVTLRDFFASGKPVILSLNYYRCPALCGMMLNGLADAAKEMSLELGEDYQIVTISFDPAESYSAARLKKNAYLAYLGDTPGVEAGWHFLTGETEAIAAVADAVGYRYAWMEGVNQWSHPNAIMLLDGEGKLFRYLYPAAQYREANALASGGGFRYDPRTLRTSLVETSAGEIGTIVDRIVLTCFAFDPHAGKYSRLAMGVMQAGGALTAILITSIVIGFLVWERKRSARVADVGQEDAEAGRTPPPTGRDA